MNTSVGSGAGTNCRTGVGAHWYACRVWRTTHRTLGFVFDAQPWRLLPNGNGNWQHRYGECDSNESFLESWWRARTSIQMGMHLCGVIRALPELPNHADENQTLCYAYVWTSVESTPALLPWAKTLRRACYLRLTHAGFIEAKWAHVTQQTDEEYWPLAFLRLPKTRLPLPNSLGLGCPLKASVKTERLLTPRDLMILFTFRCTNWCSVTGTVRKDENEWNTEILGIKEGARSSVITKGEHCTRRPTSIFFLTFRCPRVSMLRLAEELSNSPKKIKYEVTCFTFCYSWYGSSVGAETLTLEHQRLSSFFIQLLSRSFKTRTFQ